MRLYLVAHPHTAFDPVAVIAQWREMTGDLATEYVRVDSYYVPRDIVYTMTPPPRPQDLVLCPRSEEAPDAPPDQIH